MRLVRRTGNLLDYRALRGTSNLFPTLCLRVDLQGSDAEQLLI